MKNIIKLTESKIRQIVKETLEDEMALWNQRDESEFGQIIRKLDNIMKEMFSEPDEYGFQNSPISHYVTAYALDGDEMYTAKKIYSILGNYDMLQEPEVEILLDKMLKIIKKKNIKENENYLRNLVKESIEKTLNENHWKFQPSEIVMGDNTMEKLETIVYNLTRKSIETDYNGNVNWEEFADGVSQVYNMSFYKKIFDEKNIGIEYRKYNSQGKGEEYYNSISNYYNEYLDDYLDNIDIWDKYLSNVDEIKEMVEYFKQWIKNKIENEIKEYTEQKEIELDVIYNKFK